MFKALLSYMLFRPGSNEISTTKLSVIGGIITGIATIWGAELDPRILKTAAVVAGSGVINGLRNAQD